MVWGKYRVCKAAFFVKLWMLGFGFDMSERMSENISESMSKDMSERMSENISESMSKDMSERMSEDMSERMSKDMSERCQKEYRKICQKICQKEWQKECQKICQKECQKICQKECHKIASSQSAKLRVKNAFQEMSCMSTLTWPDQADISGYGEKTLWSTRWKPGERKVWHLALACSSEGCWIDGDVLQAWCENGTLSGAVDAAVSDEAEVLMLKQSAIFQQIGIPYCLEFTSRLLHFWS